MHFNLVTLFPDFFSSPLAMGLMHRAVEKGIASFSLHNPRDKSTNKHQNVDDRPYGGGAGMVMLAEPLAATLESIGHAHRGEQQAARLIYLSPKGKPLSQSLARELSTEKTLTIICGRYEGIDARIEELFPVECISVGDFVLNGGESAALCLIESVARLLPDFMGDEASGTEESFSDGLLEYPHYTRPMDFRGVSVPEVLRSGDHGRIAKWRREQSVQTTLHNRPELLQDACLTEADQAFLCSLLKERKGRNLYCALVHYPVLDKYKNSVAVSLTNLDIHDIARSSCTFGLGGYYILTPILDQQKLLADILRHWQEGAGKSSNPARDIALSKVKGLACVEEAILDIEKITGQHPLVLGTAARLTQNQTFGFARVREELAERPVLLLFGTGHGLAYECESLCQGFLPPVRWQNGYNHLSVRSAVAIILDRVLGDWN